MKRRQRLAPEVIDSLMGPLALVLIEPTGRGTSWAIEKWAYVAGEPDQRAPGWDLGLLIEEVGDRLTVRGVRATLDDLDQWFERAQRRTWTVPGLHATLYSDRTNHISPEAVPEFLEKTVPALRELGHEVEVVLAPPPLRREQIEWHFNAEVPSGHLSIDSLCEFEWWVTVGGERLSEQELREAVRDARPVVLSDGQHVEVDLDDARSIVLQLDQLDGLQEARLRDLLGLDGVQPSTREPFVDGWTLLAELAGADASRLPASESLPDDVAAQLRSYQRDGVVWMRQREAMGLGAVLADEMGLGKTRQVLALAALDDPGEGTTLIVCPRAVLTNWIREAQQVAPSLRSGIHHGSDRVAEDRLARWATGQDLVVTTYETMVRDASSLTLIPWRRVVFDEAQRLKNPRSVRTKVARDLAAQVPRRIAMTGTPVENRVSDIWSILNVVNPGLIHPSRIERLVDGQSPALSNPLRTVLLRRTKLKVAVELPDKIEVRHWCSLTERQTVLYQAAVEEVLERASDLSGLGRSGAVLQGLSRLKQICDHPILVDPQACGASPIESDKAQRLIELLEEIVDDGEQALVFTQYAVMARHLHTIVRSEVKVAAGLYTGSMSEAERARAVDAFSSGASKVLVISLLAGGVGINLTAANHVIHFDRWWNPAVEDQATDRAHRIGQLRTVEVHHLLCEGTLEERIDDLILEKRELARALLSNVEGPALSELTDDQLRDLVQLR